MSTNQNLILEKDLYENNYIPRARIAAGASIPLSGGSQPPMIHVGIIS